MITKIKQKENGITLIALVITIIILLILAGVAVSIGLSGDNLFGKANEAKTSWNRDVNEENTTLNNYIAYLDQYTGGIGDLVLPNITNKTTQENNNALAKVTNPLKSKFTTDTTYSNKAQGNFYDALEEAKNDNDKRWKGRTEADSVRYKYLYSKN